MISEKHELHKILENLDNFSKIRIISFSGLDSSGKTTVSKRLVECLNKQGKDAVYLHCGNFSIFGMVSKLFKNRVKNIKDKQYLGKGIGILGSLRRLSYILDLFRFKVFMSLNKEKIIVCDRYFYDLLVHGQYFKHFGEKFSRFYLSHIPKPDQAYFLDVPIRIAMTRNKMKNESLQTEHFFKEKLRLYSRLNVDFIKIKNWRSLKVMLNLSLKWGM